MRAGGWIGGPWGVGRAARGAAMGLVRARRAAGGLRRGGMGRGGGEKKPALCGLCWGGDGLYAREGVAAGASCST